MQLIIAISFFEDHKKIFIFHGGYNIQPGSMERYGYLYMLCSLSQGALQSSEGSSMTCPCLLSLVKVYDHVEFATIILICVLLMYWGVNDSTQCTLMVPIVPLLYRMQGFAKPSAPPNWTWILVDSILFNQEVIYLQLTLLPTEEFINIKSLAELLGTIKLSGLTDSI